MLPKWHVLLGAIFTLLLWAVAPTINPIYLSLVFLSSFLIDFDHYLASALKSKRILGLRDSFRYHDKKIKEEKADISAGIKKKGDFHLFHTIEFHVFVGLLGILFIPLFYIFIGMLFHSLLDVYDGLRKGWLHRREFFLSNWVRKGLRV